MQLALGAGGHLMPQGGIALLQPRLDHLSMEDLRGEVSWT